jgi:hypothetical protein
MQPRGYGGEAHAGFKGFHAADFQCCGGAENLNVEIYLLPHIISSPKARSVLHHSYQLWILDESGNVSYWQGKLFSNNLGIGTRLDRAGANLIAVDQASLDAGFHPNESWYFGTAVGGVDGKWSIQRVNYLHDPTDDVDDPSTWNLAPLPNLGLRRNFDIVLRKQRSINSGAPLDEVFCVGNQSESLIGGEIMDCAVGGLPQFIASTLPDGSGSTGKTEWRTFDRNYECLLCEVPN